MFHVSILISVVVVVFIHVNARVNADDTDYIDHIVSDCQNKEKMFEAKENKYALQTPGGPDEPTLFGPLFPEQARQLSVFEKNQRKLECVADALQVYCDISELYSSPKYSSLVSQCKAIQPNIPKCDPFNPYRNINGTCNNLFNPNLGGTYHCFKRLFPANYEGVSGLRVSVIDKKPLPNARDVSRALVKPVIRRTQRYNSLFAFFGQAIAHDIAQFPFTEVGETGDIDCCTNSPDEDLHPQCLPIDIDRSDPFYSTYNVTCFNLVRAVPCITCSLEKRVPINAVTGWLDCSMVYGMTDNKAKEVRRNDGSGKLKSQERNSCEILPADLDIIDICGNKEKGEFCFKGGDNRLNQQTPLMMFQTLFLEEHNRIAGILQVMNPHWDDERIYQESRKILTAEWHVIIYNEYLPVLLGPKLMQRKRLNINGEWDYNPLVNPTLSVEFNGAAFRIHSILPSIAVHNERNEYLRYMYQNSTPIYNDDMSKFLFNMAHTDGEKYDWYMPRDVTNYAYKPLFGNYGFDLAAIDIQRGRDVGLPTYVHVIENILHLQKAIESFDDLKRHLSPECIEILEELYADVRDVDLSVGIICEKIPEDMTISRTAARIIADHFQKLKFGDRFWFEFDKFWTYEQRQSLKRASLAKLICDNTKVDSFQPSAFKFPSERNMPQPCWTIPGVDFSLWRENPQN